jgi:hypothetical protein
MISLPLTWMGRVIVIYSTFTKRGSGVHRCRGRVPAILVAPEFFDLF